MSYYLRDMLSINTRNLLAEYLAKNISSAAAIEPFRCALADIPYFDTIGLFRFFDQEQKGYLTYQDFKYSMGSINKKYLQYAFSRIDTLKVGQISKLQFSSFLLPKEHNQLKQLVAQRMSEPQIAQSQPQTIGQQIEIFSKMIQQIIVDQIQELSPLRQKLLKSEDYSVQAIINALDTGRHGYIGAKDFFKFIKGQGIDIIESDVDFLIQLYDSDLDGKMKKDEIQWAIQGLQNENGCSYLQKLNSSINKPTKKKQQQKKTQQHKKTKQTKHTKENNTKKQDKQNKQQKNQMNTVKKEKFMLDYQDALEKYKMLEAQANEIDEELIRHDVQMQAELDQIRSKTINNIKEKKQMLLKEQIIREEIQKRRKVQQQQIIQRQVNLRMQRQKIILQQQKRMQILEKERIRNDILWKEEQRKILQQQQLQYQREKAKALQPIQLESIRNNYPTYTDLAMQRQYLEMQINEALAKRPFSSDYSNVYNPNIRQHLQRTQYYLQQSKILRIKIKQQREKQKNLQNHIKSLYQQKRFEKSIPTKRINTDFIKRNDLISPQKNHHHQHMTPTTAFISTLKKKL